MGGEIHRHVCSVCRSDSVLLVLISYLFTFTLIVIILINTEHQEFRNLLFVWEHQLSYLCKRVLREYIKSGVVIHPITSVHI